MTAVEHPASLQALLFEGAPVGLAYLDRDLRYVELNEALAVINGFPVEEHLGRSVPELWPDLDARVVSGLRRVLATGEPIEQLELSGVTPAAPGVVRSFLHSYRPVFDGAGTVVGLNCSVMDITDLKASEAAARRAAAVTATFTTLSGILAGASSVDECARSVVTAALPVFDAITAGMFLLEGDMFVGTGATGYSDQVMAAFGRWPADEPSPAADAIRTGEVQLYTTLGELEAKFPPLGAAMREATGERRIAIAPLVVDGSAIGALHVGFATEGALDAEDLRNLRALADAGAQAIARIRLADVARRDRQMLVASIEQMPLGVVIVDERGGVVHENREAIRILQGAAPAVDSFGDFGVYRGFHADGRPYEAGDWPVVRSVVHGEVVVDEETTVLTFAGEHRIVSVSSAPVEDDAGRRLGAVTVFGDVTARRAAEQAREAFLGMLSHELRTPVTTIYGSAHLLGSIGDRLDLTVQRELLDEIEQSSANLSRMVDNLLVLARAERGATHLEAVPVLVRHLVARLIAREAPQWPNARLVLVAGEVVPVMGDDGMIDLMLSNLIGNAAKYAGGEVTIVLEPEGDALRVAVRDHGPGIPQDELEAVFDLFHRSTSTSRAAPGSGIGLFVVRHLASAQGGTSWARNLPEGGLEVGFTLPRAQDDGFDAR